MGPEVGARAATSEPNSWSRSTNSIWISTGLKRRLTRKKERKDGDGKVEMRVGGRSALVGAAGYR